MEYVSVLARLTALPGVTGHEQKAQDAAFEYLGGYTGDVWRDRLGNVFARTGEGGPTVLIAAHMDEIGMMVTDILDNGFLRIASVAGVDPRVLPGSEVLVDGRQTLRGVIGAVPPHLLKERENSYKMTELAVDLGLAPEKARELVTVGDVVRFDAPAPLELKNNMLASKTLDDRSHVAIMLGALEILAKRKLSCTAVFCATVQEEFGGIGGTLAAWGVNPDIAIAIDVCHGKLPGATPYESFAMDRVVLTKGSNIHPGVYRLLCAAAAELNIETDTEVCIGPTGTDAWNMQIARGGVATAIVGVPLKYMHTSVEVVSIKTLDSCAKLIAQFIANLGGDWEEKLCLDD